MKNNELEILMQFPRIIYMIMRKIMRGFHFSQYGLELNQTQRRTLLILLNKGASSMTQLHDLVGLEKGTPEGRDVGHTLGIDVGVPDGNVVGAPVGVVEG